MRPLRAYGPPFLQRRTPAQKQGRGIFTAEGSEQVQLVIKRIGTFVQPNLRVVELGGHQTGGVALAHLRLQTGAEFRFLVRRQRHARSLLVSAVAEQDIVQRL